MMIKETNKFFDQKYLNDFYEKKLNAKTYNQQFSIVDRFFIIGDPSRPLETIPKELQVFSDPIIYIYILEMSETLDWHRDEMRMDFLASAKYAAIIEGSGTLESKNNDIIETFDFNNETKLQWVSFLNTLPHRFIVKEKAKMIMAITVEQSIADNFNNSYFWSTEVDSVNKQVWEQRKLT